MLRRGATVKGRVVGPDGQPVHGAWIISRLIVDPRSRVLGKWTGRNHDVVANGQFEIHGVDPDADIPVYFLEPKRKLGGAVNLSPKSAAGGPINIRLEPCGRPRAIDRAWRQARRGSPSARDAHRQDGRHTRPQL